MEGHVNKKPQIQVHMKSYIATSGVIFSLIVAAHIVRLFAEGPHLLKEPVFVFTSLLNCW